MGRVNEILLPNLGMTLYSAEHSLENWGIVDDLRQASRYALQELYGSLDGYAEHEPQVMPESFHFFAQRECGWHHIIACQKLKTAVAMRANLAKEETGVLHQVDSIAKLEDRLLGLGVFLPLADYADHDKLTPEQREFVKDIGAISVLHASGIDISRIDIALVPVLQRQAVLTYQRAMLEYRML